MESALFFVLLVATSLIPSVLFTAWVRNQEGHGREPWAAVLRSFLYGAIIGTTVALLLNTVFETAAYTYGLSSGLGGGFLTAVVFAPFIEEAVKGGGLGLQRRMLQEPEDGLVYGAAIGFGFAATENLIYGATAWLEQSEELAISTVLLRAVSSTILHGGVSALLGFGYCRAVLGHGFGAAQVIPYYLTAVFLHAGFNFLVRNGSVIALVASIFLVWFIFYRANAIIARLDAMPHQRA